MRQLNMLKITHCTIYLVYIIQYSVEKTYLPT